MNKHVERHYPLVGGTFVALACWALDVSPASNVEAKDLLSGALAMGAIFTGFTSTILGILTGITTDNTRRLRGSIYWPLFVDYLGTAILTAGTYCVICLLGFFLNLKLPDAHGTPKVTEIGTWYFPIWTGFTVTMLATFYRVLVPFLSLIRAEKTKSTPSS